MKRIMWILKLAAIGVSSLILVPGISSAGDKATTNTTVKIDNFSFGPANVTIAAGTTVTWTNHDDVPHVVASDDKLFKSKALDTDDHFSFTFSKPGTYTYYCSIHPKMTARVVVK